MSEENKDILNKNEKKEKKASLQDSRKDLQRLETISWRALLMYLVLPT